MIGKEDEDDETVCLECFECFDTDELLAEVAELVDESFFDSFFEADDDVAAEESDLYFLCESVSGWVDFSEVSAGESVAEVSVEDDPDASN